MSFWPGEKLRYAETHFKFKLPWSLLYKPWPEIIFDAPFQFVPGVEPYLWIVVRDADRFPATIKSAEIVLKARTQNAQQDALLLQDAQQTQDVPQPDIIICKELNIEVREQMRFIPLALGKIPTGTYEAHCKLTVEREGKSQTFERWNLPRLKPVPLRFKVLNETPPIALERDAPHRPRLRRGRNALPHALLRRPCGIRRHARSFAARRQSGRARLCELHGPRLRLCIHTRRLHQGSGLACTEIPKNARRDCSAPKER